MDTRMLMINGKRGYFLQFAPLNLLTVLSRRGWVDDGWTKFHFHFEDQSLSRGLI